MSSPCLLVDQGRPSGIHASMRGLGSWRPARQVQQSVRRSSGSPHCKDKSRLGRKQYPWWALLLPERPGRYPDKHRAEKRWVLRLVSWPDRLRRFVQGHACKLAWPVGCGSRVAVGEKRTPFMTACPAVNCHGSNLPLFEPRVDATDQRVNTVACDPTDGRGKRLSLTCTSNI